MNTAHPTQGEACPKSTLSTIAAAQTQLDELAETFKFFITTNRAGITLVDCRIVIEEAEKLLKALQAIKHAMTGHAIPEPTGQPDQAGDGFQLTPPRRISLDDVMHEQARQRGFDPMPLESDLLIKRVADGGYSGQFLADAFISAYRTDTSFPHSLGGLIKLDAEAFRLFHECLHIRHISGWNDDTLYAIEQQINAIVGGVE